MGKRKVYEGHSALAHRIHSFSTSTKFVQPSAILPLRLLFSLQNLNRRKFFLKGNSVRVSYKQFLAVEKNSILKINFLVSDFRDDQIRKFQSGRRR